MKLGFIGTGNMATAIMSGVIKKGLISANEIIGSDLSAASREKVAASLGIHVTASNLEVAEKAEVIVLSIKPQYYADVIAEINDVV